MLPFLKEEATDPPKRYAYHRRTNIKSSAHALSLSLLKMKIHVAGPIVVLFAAGVAAE
jgi:hypothetical protein